ncbi:hypothetical protein [Roseococcus pinisoli]|uniref:DUF4089 domain-containing protein n=1 Tax=Roseococcus pinisoli TaxID=2835040 RepID=A0ABS5QE66_9PROT|nr:hypothetical protein [Roseococcus pinisoli]MBS7811673.1 hypothetical protein [Roseococcus pinisoli]
MPDMLSPEHLAVLLAQAGISLPPAEVEDLRQAHAKVLAMAALLREPAVPLAAEPAFTFATGEEA